MRFLYLISTDIWGWINLYRGGLSCARCAAPLPLPITCQRHPSPVTTTRKLTDMTNAFSDVVSQFSVWEVETQLWVESRVRKCIWFRKSEFLYSHISKWPWAYEPPWVLFSSLSIRVTYDGCHWFVVIIPWKLHLRVFCLWYAGKSYSFMAYRFLNLFVTFLDDSRSPLFY